MTLPYNDVQKMLKWVSTKFALIKREPRAKNRTVKRGYVYWCEFGENIGSEQSLKRPALVLQNDPANGTSPNTIVAPITNAASANRVVVPLDRPEDSPIQGYVLLGNVVTVSKARLGDYIDELSSDEMLKVEEALYHSFGVFSKVSKTKQHLERTLRHLEDVKKQRNQAVDSLKAIKKQLGLPESATEEDVIKNIESLTS